MIAIDDILEERLLSEARRLLDAFAGLRSELDRLESAVREMHTSLERGRQPHEDAAERRAAERRAADRRAADLARLAPR